METKTTEYQDKAKGERLTAMGTKETTANLSNKIARGDFMAGFFI